jgi:hypothetical protein
MSGYKSNNNYNETNQKHSHRDLIDGMHCSDIKIAWSRRIFFSEKITEYFT